MADERDRQQQEGKGMGIGVESVVHQSYVLRLWREGATYRLWRATLQSVSDSTERHSFPDLDSLIIYLLSHFRSGLPAEEGDRA